MRTGPAFLLYPSVWRMLGAVACLFLASPAKPSVQAQEHPVKPVVRRPVAPTPLPLDPLTKDEEARAERLALADPRVKELLGTTQHRLVSITLLALKPELRAEGHETPEQSKQIVRHAEVVFFRPEGEIGVRAVVNLNGSSVKEVSRLDGDQVPLTADDLAIALPLALRNEEVRKALGPAAESFRVEQRGETLGSTAGLNVVRALRVRGKSAGDPCSKHRCLQLFFRRGAAFLQQPAVIVDLTASQVYVERSEQ
jgi:hypothetical protein